MSKQKQQQLLDQLNKRKKELEIPKEKMDEELKWLEKFLKQANFDNPLEFEKIDIKMLLCTYIRANCKDADISSTEEIADKFLPIINQYIPHVAVEATYILIEMAFSDDWDSWIKPAIEDKNAIRRSMFLSLRFGLNSIRRESKNFILSYKNAETNIKIVETLRTRSKVEDKEAWLAAIDLASVVKDIASRKEVIAPHYSDIREMAALKDMMSTITGEIRTIEDYKSRLTQEKKVLAKELRRINQVCRDLPHLPDGIIDDYQQYIQGINDIRSLNLIIDYIINHPYYSKLAEAEKEYKSKQDYQILLERFDVAIDNELEELAEKYGYETLDGILQTLIQIGFTDQLSEALKQVTPEYLAEINKLLQQNIIPPQLLVANVSLLNPQNQMVERVQQNLSSLQMLPKFYTHHPSTLLVEPEVLRRNMMLIKNSDYLESLSVTRDVAFLASGELEESIILALELGLETILEENLDLLNTPVSRLKRLHIAKDLGLPMETASEIKRILNEEEFIAPDEKLDSYILPRNAVLEPEQLAAMPLEETKRTYCVGGIIIAKMRLGEDVREKPNKTSLMKSRQISSREYHQYIKCN